MNPLRTDPAPRGAAATPGPSLPKGEDSMLYLVTMPKMTEDQLRKT
jgi:hypothetical protein